MKIYFAPLAASMATRICLYEAGVDATYVEVDPVTKELVDSGGDFRSVYPLGMVPALQTDEGTMLFENAAILQYVASRFPQARLAPTDDAGRTDLHRWLSFVGMEIHRGLFAPLLDRKAPAAMKEYLLETGKSRLAHLSRHLDGREFLLDGFSVADAYLVALLGTAPATPLSLADHPVLAAYHARLSTRPSIERAVREERTLYGKELARRKAEALASAV